MVFLRQTWGLAVIVGTCSLLHACSVVDSEYSSSSALVGGSSSSSSASAPTSSTETLKKAEDIVYGINYLPFAYLDFGCEARSLYMSMELAAEEIPSSAGFAIVNSNDERLVINDPHSLNGRRITWIHHVAPILWLDSISQNNVRVLDPGFNKRDLRLEDWLRLMNADKVQQGFSLVAVAGSEYNYNNMRGRSEVYIRSFAEMPAFSAKDIIDACNTLHPFIAREANSRPEVVKMKQGNLVRRTGELIEALNGLGKISTSQSFRLRCGSQNIQAPSLLTQSIPTMQPIQGSTGGLPPKFSTQGCSCIRTRHEGRTACAYYTDPSKAPVFLAPDLDANQNPICQEETLRNKGDAQTRELWSHCASPITCD